MPTHAERFRGQWFSSNGRYYTFKIYHKGSTTASVPLKVGGGGVKIKYDTSGQEKFSPIIASKCTISLVVDDDIFGHIFETFVDILRVSAEEGDATLVVWNDSSNTPLWSGNLMLDLSAKEDVSKPYEVELTATDGIGLLKNYDMVKTQGTNPYSPSDTYLSDGYQTFIYWIKEILQFCNTPDADTTAGDVSDYTFSTAVDWWYEDHPAADPSISPLAYTQCQMVGGYEVTENGLYKVKTVYDVLESICKLWGMRVVFWRNTFYFTQIELYNTADSGTYATPDNIDTQIWTKAGVLSSSQDFIGDTWYTLYSQEISDNAGGFDGGLQKLAGSKWDYYPKLKEVTVDFESISNNNFFTTFPQPSTDGDGTYPTTYSVDLITSTSLGTHTGAAGFGGFNVLFILDFDNGSGGQIDYRTNATIRARPNGDTNWNNGYYFDTDTTTWIAYPQEGGGTAANEVWVKDPIINNGYNNTGNAFNDEPAVKMFTLPLGTSQQTVYSGYIPTDAAFVGDWDFELFNLACVSGISGWTPAYFWGHAGGDIALHYFNLSLTENVSYSDPLDINGNPLSQFNPILSNTIGGSLNTSVYSARSETQKQEVKDIWWGDTLTHGEPSSLIWIDDVGGSGYTDPNGLWRNGQTGSFNKLIQELLGEARLFNQQQSDYKWSLSTAVSDMNSSKDDGTATRPVYVNPVGKIQDTIQNIFYYLLRGTFDIGVDEWHGEWLEVSYKDITVTTTTTGSGGTNPTNNTNSARLSSPSTSRLNAFLNIGGIRTRIAGGTTITSIDIDIMNPLANEDEESPALRMFEQNTLLRTGDVINISANGSNGQTGRFQQFEVSADVENGDNTMSVTSITTTRAIEVGDHITVNLRDLYQQSQHKTRGSIGGLTIASSTLGAADEGIFIDNSSDEVGIGTASPSEKLEVNGNVKATAFIGSPYSLTHEFLMATCTQVILTSATDGEAYAVTIPFNTEAVQSGTDINISEVVGEENNIRITSTTGVYQFEWNLVSNTSTVNNRLNCGVKLQQGTWDEGEESWSYADLDPSKCYIYNRANGPTARLGSTAGSILVNHDKSETDKIYRLVFWKDTSSSAGTKGTTVIDGTQMTIKKLT